MYVQNRAMFRSVKYAALLACLPLVQAQTTIAFEVAAVKPAGPVPTAGRDVPAGNSAGCDGGFPRLNGRQFAVTTTTYALISWAYGYNKTWGCSYVNFSDLITGGPAWIRNERFEVQALIPEGVSVTLDGFMKGEAPPLELMLQQLLADRFKLVVHRATKDVSSYALTVGKGGPKLTRPAPEEKSTMGTRRQTTTNGQVTTTIVGKNVELRDLAFLLLMNTRRPVLDRTGLTGSFNFNLEFAPLNADSFVESSASSLFTAVQEQLGLRLETMKAPLEGVVIDSAERPSEN
jgi:uncharacterized protein (TIGR03435 family)